MTLCFVHSPLSFEFEGKEVLVGVLVGFGQRGEPLLCNPDVPYHQVSFIGP